MKKGFFIVILILFIIMFPNLEKREEIRVRVIPKSNSIVDLQRKKEVKDKLKEILQEYEIYKSYKELDEALSKNVEKINEELGKDVSVTYDYHNFEEKTYDGNIIDKTNCKTLLVIILDGQGDNWWGTLYPSFLGIESEEKLTYESYLLKLIRG